MIELEEVKAALKLNDLTRALELSGRFVSDNPDCTEGWFVRGKTLWRMGQRQPATSCYARAASLDGSSPAVAALEHARAIEDFFNPDLLNP